MNSTRGTGAVIVSLLQSRVVAQELSLHIALDQSPNATLAICPASAARHCAVPPLPLPLSSMTTGADTASEADGHLIFIFLLTALAVGIVTRYICSRLRIQVPYISTLLLVMTVLGLVQLGSSQLADAEKRIAGINGRLLQTTFLPVLVLEGARQINIRNFKRLLPVILLLLVPGSAISILLTAVLIYYGLPAYQWDWITCLLVGAMLLPTTTSTLVRAMRKAGASERLSAIIEGESVLLSCVAFILVSLFTDILFSLDSTSLLEQTVSSPLDVGQEVGKFVKLAACSPLFGYAVGMAVVFFLYRVINDAMTEITTVLAAVYAVYYVSSSHLQLNGNLAVVAFGFYFCQWERHTISPSVFSSLRDVLGSLFYVSQTLIYAISGVMAAYYIFVAASITGTDAGYCFALYLFDILTRGVSALLLLPIIRALGYKLNYKDVMMLSYSGIRGSLALVLMLSVVLNPAIAPSVSHQIGFQVSGIVLLTNIINAPTANWFIRLLKLRSDNPEGKLVLQAAVEQMEKEGQVEIARIKLAPEFQGASWDAVSCALKELCDSTVVSSSQSHGVVAATGAQTNHIWYSFQAAVMKRYEDSRSNRPLTLMSPSSSAQLSDAAEFITEASPTLPLDAAYPSGTKQREELTERFLELQRTEYHRLYDAGCLSRAATVALMRSIDASLDRRDLSQQWKVIESTLRVPRWLTFLYSSARLRRLQLFNRLVDRQVFLHFCVSVEVSSAFCRVEAKLAEFLVSYPILASINPAAMEDIQREVAVYAGRARAAFDDIRSAFPEVYSSVHCRHAALTLLTTEEKTLSRLHDSGLLSSLEFERLQETVSHLYVQVKRARPNNQLPSTEELLLSQPIIRHMQPFYERAFLSRGQRQLLPHHTWIIGDEADTGARAEEGGVYLIVRGQVGVYYHRSAASSLSNRGQSESGGASFALVEEASTPDATADHEHQQRLGVGSFLAARRMFDSGIDLYKTVTACELYYLSPLLLRLLQADPSFEESIMKAAAIEALRSSFAHLQRFASMAADAIAALVSAATFVSSPESHSTFGRNNRVFLLQGHIAVIPPPHIDSPQPLSVIGPALITLRDGPCSVQSTGVCSWLIWSVADEDTSADVRAVSADKREESCESKSADNNAARA